MSRSIQHADYYISFGPIQQTLDELLSRSRSYSTIGILVDENTKTLCLPLLSIQDLQFPIIEIPSGEKHKNIRICEHIWSEMAKYRFDRTSLLINLGGGVIGDMGGFAASCYMRGIPFVQIPTTLLSQVDASVGGKLGIDFHDYKNFIGLFRHPQAVLIDDQFLTSLPPSQLRSGYAEMLKHGLIKDRSLWKRLISQDDWTQHNWSQELYASVLIKYDVVCEDPLERGIRQILNFGHTVGHAIESLSLKTDHPLLHGEAIALGIMIESWLSVSLAGLDVSACDEIIDYLMSVYQGLDIEILKREDEIIDLMRSDKKNQGGLIFSALLEQIGRCTYRIELVPDQIRLGLRHIYERYPH